MAEALGARPRVPTPTATCPGCGKLVDPLRAGQVAIFGGRFEYFCVAECKIRFLRTLADASYPDDARTLEPPEVAAVTSALVRSDVVPRGSVSFEEEFARLTAPKVSSPSEPPSAPSSIAPPASVETPSKPAPRPSDRPTTPPDTLRSAPDSAVYFPAVTPATNGVATSPAAAPGDARAQAPAHATSNAPAHAAGADAPPADFLRPAGEDPSRRPPTPEEIASPTPPEVDRPTPVAAAGSKLAGIAVVEKYRGSIVPALGIAAGLLAPSFALLGQAGGPYRLVAAVVAALAWAAYRAGAARPRGETFVMAEVTLGMCGLGAAWSALESDAGLGSTGFGRLTSLAGLLVAALFGADAVVARAVAATARARQAIADAMGQPLRVVRGDDVLLIPAADVKPGEQVLVEADEWVGVDGTVLAGEAEVHPWLDASVTCKKTEGDALLAGAKVLRGRLRITTVWSARDRAWEKLAVSPESRLDAVAALPKLARALVVFGAASAGCLCALASVASHGTAEDVVVALLSGAVVVAWGSVSMLVSEVYARGNLRALEHGIAFKDARAFDRAGQVDTAVLCARGTVLTGEPEIVAVEPFGNHHADRVLALSAGAEMISSHPLAVSVVRAARVQALRLEDVRNATLHEGMGVTALVSSGERLAVGNRTLLLTERVSVAVADSRIAELEAQGRSVLLVAVGGRLIGLIALQDALRPGSRAAVQRMHDARIEPVLLSGEARETCETMGRALDIEHIRPEVLPADRGAEVRALSEAGHVVAAIGHPATDDGALGAADVSVAMSAAGSAPGEWAVGLASDDIRDAAQSLSIAHDTRVRARRLMVVAVVPGTVALLLVVFGILPPVLSPLFALAGLAGAGEVLRR